jgi:hypothetical protein
MSMFDAPARAAQAARMVRAVEILDDYGGDGRLSARVAGWPVVMNSRGRVVCSCPDACSGRACAHKEALQLWVMQQRGQGGQ